MVNAILWVLLMGVTIVAMQSCNVRDLQINRLNRQIDELNQLSDDHKLELHKRCQDAVDRTCNYADCAVISIEQMQDEVCTYLEKL